jgi:hypothetical protein
LRHVIAPNQRQSRSFRRLSRQSLYRQFWTTSQFDAYADDDSVAVRLVRPGEDRREAVMHLHYGLLADILVELARSLASRPQLDEQHRNELAEAAKQLCASLKARPKI